MEKVVKKKTVSFLSAAILLLVAIFLYSYRLDKVPVHLNQDELEFSLNAYSVSRTLRDTNGNYLPLYFWHLESFWATPIITYLTAIILKFAPIAESTIRLPSVLIGLCTIVLLMILANKIFKEKQYAIITGFLAVTTPVLFMHSRLLLDNLYPVPFVLFWLIFLKEYLDKRKIFFLFAAGLSLGIGLHSYHAAKIMMPVYFLASLMVLLIWEKTSVKAIALLVAGFAIPTLMALPWFFKYPDSFIANQISYISGINRSINPESGFWGVVNTKRLAQIASSFFEYFGPKILFISGDKSLIHSTQHSGAFTFPVLFLLTFGILYVLFKTKDKFSKLILFGFLSYPTAPALVGEPSRISRGLVVIPFAILLSLWGIKYLFSFKDKAIRFLIYAFFLGVLLQFFLFLIGYFGTYRKESYSQFNNDIGGAMESAIKSTKIRKVNEVYIDQNIYFIEQYVKFYSLKFSSDLESRVVYFDPALKEFSFFPIYSLVVVKAEDISGRIDRVGKFEKIETIREPNGYETFYIYYRDK